MATHTGSEGLIKIGTDTLGELRSYSLETTGDTIEDTSMGDSTRTYKSGLTAWSGTASLYFDRTRGGYAKDTQVIEISTDEGVLYPIGGIRVVVRVLYHFTSGTP